jgi:UDP-N-acetylglucosamine 4,6-dehydratase
MTRFWITLDDAARLVIRCFEQMQGGEIFVPKMASMKLLDMAQAVAPNCEIECIGIRPGEKLHEVLLAEDEARNSVEKEDIFVIQPPQSLRRKEDRHDGIPVAEGFRYASDSNSEWLTVQELYSLIQGSAPPLTSLPNGDERHIQ